jgi:hypothetical protein
MRRSAGPQRAHGIVRGWAELIEGTRMRFHCPSGHSWEEDLNRSSLPLPKRVGAMGCRFYASWWSQAKGGVTVLCKACKRQQLAAEKGAR